MFYNIINKFSLLLNYYLSYYCLICILCLLILTGCYSFRGGSVPEHLNTISITAVKDNSGYGNPTYREDLYRKLVSNFQSDNALDLTDRNGDARLTVAITNIRDEMQTVKPGEVESERKISVSCTAEYYDAVKKKVIWEKSFSNFEVYDLTNAQVERDNAVSKALEQTSDDILLAVVSGW